MKYFVFVSLSFILLFNVNAQYGREEAIEIVKEEVIGLDLIRFRVGIYIQNLTYLTRGIQ